MQIITSNRSFWTYTGSDWRSPDGSAGSFNAVAVVTEDGNGLTPESLAAVVAAFDDASPFNLSRYPDRRVAVSASKITIDFLPSDFGG